MKHALTLLLVWASVVAASAQTALPRVARVRLFGREYVRVEDWARANGGEVHWLVPKQELRVTLPCGVVSLTVDSRKAVVKGVHVWLSNPIAYNNGSAYLGGLDLATAIHPVLFPARYSARGSVRTIVLDPGHGGKDPGNKEGARVEKVYTLSFAREVAEMLTKAGFKVSMTRSGDSFVELPVRPDLARRRNADLFISLHFNSADGPGASTVQGTEVFCMTPVRASSTNAGQDQSGAGAGPYPGNRLDAKNMLLAYQIQKAITQQTGTEDRGVKRARFWVLRNAEMPAVLVEAAFMTHPADARRVYEPAQRRQTAQAIVDGVLAYKKLTERL
jgi:N-acetylmuramoyl-L-alanine amidase